MFSGNWRTPDIDGADCRLGPN